MIYQIFIKLFRVWSFLTFFGSAFVFGIENGVGLESIANLDAWNDIKFPIVFSLGFWIVINLGAIFLTRFDRFVWAAYFDDMFTVVIDGEIRETYKTNNFWNHVWPCLRETENFKVYYNDPTASKRFHRLF